MGWNRTSDPACHGEYDAMRPSVDKHNDVLLLSDKNNNRIRETMHKTCSQVASSPEARSIPISYISPSPQPVCAPLLSCSSAHSTLPLFFLVFHTHQLGEPTTSTQHFGSPASSVSHICFRYVNFFYPSCRSLCLNMPLGRSFVRLQDPEPVPVSRSHVRL